MPIDGDVRQPSVTLFDKASLLPLFNSTIFSGTETHADHRTRSSTSPESCVTYENNQNLIILSEGMVLCSFHSLLATPNQETELAHV